MRIIRPIMFAALALVVLMPAAAWADKKKDIQTKTKQAMESFDLLEFEAARGALGYFSTTSVNTESAAAGFPSACNVSPM